MSSMSAPKQRCTLTQGEVMVSAHLMSIQIDDGSPGDAFHSLEEKLREEWTNVCFLSEGDTFTIQILYKGLQSKTSSFHKILHLS